MITCPKCGTEYSGAERFCPKDGTRLGSTGEGAPVRMPSLPPNQDPLINNVIQGRYKVLNQIGEGGMGVVYIAEHVDIEKKVALKVLRDDFSKRPEVVARFKQEARSAGKIGNEHIVDVTDFGQLDQGGVYFVMEYLQGQGLSDVIRSEVLGVERAAAIVLQIAEALNAAHKLGIVHRDLKPENIFLVEDDSKRDFVKILDFGIAKISDRDSEGQRLTKTGMIFGTPEYMSPEQAAGKPLDHRVDIYALGCIMFEMFTGMVPFEGETFMAVLTQHMFEPVPRLEDVNPDIDVPDPIKQVVYKAMEKDKDDRYADMTELSEDLEGKLEALGYVAPFREGGRTEVELRASRLRDETWTEPDWITETRGTRKEKKRKTPLIIGVLTMILLLGGTAAAYFMGYIGKGKGEERGERKELVATKTTRLDPRKDVENKIEEDSEKEKQEEETEKEEIKEEDAPVAPPKVEVIFKSKPKGAVISIAGMGQVCSETPCKLSLEDGKSVEVEAIQGDKKAKRTFTPSSQNKVIKLVLKRQRRPPRRDREDKGEKKPGGETTNNPDGLKIPDFFKNN
jgi:serine/threonine-protein kinase